MNLKSFKENLNKKVIIIDGAFGTMLQAAGLEGGCPEEYNLSAPQKIINIHKSYVQAGAQVITTNSFGANALKLKNYKLQKKVYELNFQAARLAKKAAGKSALVTGDIGPTGKLMAPFGDLKVRDAVDIFKEQVKGLIDGGADLISIETMDDILEAKAALLAVYETKKNIPVLVQFTFNSSLKTTTGSTPQTAQVSFSGFPVYAVGANCGMGPETMAKAAGGFAALALKPFVILPNAGLPELDENGKTVFRMKPKEFVLKSKDIYSRGAALMGGCCGTNPDHIKLLAQKFKNKKVKTLKKADGVFVSSRSKYIRIHPSAPFVKIGERINPTGKKEMQSELVKGNLQTVINEAINQTSERAHIIDINVGAPGVNEEKILTQAVTAAQNISSCPLAIDTSNLRALDEALVNYAGRPLINSLSAEKIKLTEWLKKAQKYGAAYIFLTLDDSGLPKTAAARMKCVEAGVKKGIRKEDAAVDSLVLTASAKQKQALYTLDAVKKLSQKGFATALGVSNISFGLPQRKIVNAAFLSAAIANGLSSAIVNTNDKLLNEISGAAEVISGKDKNSARFITLFTGALPTPADIRRKKDAADLTLYDIVLNGMKSGVIEKIKKELKKQDAQNIINKQLIPAIEKTGELYNDGIYFLPQLMLSAETMKTAMAYLNPLLSKKAAAKKGKIIMATVEGDIHDIGKNIVCVMLQNSGFDVIDLGKDVKAAAVIEAVKKHKPDFLGLSALMTTTMVKMPEIIALLKKYKIKVKTMIGGAVVTEKYAKTIGADFFAKDAVAASNLLKKLK